MATNQPNETYGINAGTEMDGMADINQTKPKETNNTNKEINNAMKDSRFAQTVTDVSRRENEEK